MSNANICRFVPYHKDYHSVLTINFVLECQPMVYDKLKSDDMYKMYYVRSGKGRLHIPGNCESLSQGDIFFTLPSVPYCLESVEDFSFYYISYIGSRGNMIMEQLGIRRTNCIFRDCSSVLPLWEECIQSPEELTDIASECTLLYTFTYLGSRLQAGKGNTARTSDTVHKVKKYIDDNFAAPDFSCETLCAALNYNRKYISSLFKRHMHVGIIDYLNTIRIQHACTMMQQGFTSVTDIANLCGYRDPQYFSRVFKERLKVSPRTYMREFAAKVPANAPTPEILPR